MRFSKMFLGFTVGLVVSVGVIGMFYYADLMPLHIDEAGYWFNFTNKDFANRGVPNQQIPNHTISIYLAKLSLSWFGYNGIGWRFPVILFGLLDIVLLFILIRAWTGDGRIASVASAFLMLIPWFAHYTHELRGYPPYLFFALTTFLALHLLLTKGDRFHYWLFLLLSFLGCYYSSLGSVVFIFNFMVVFWALKLAHSAGVLGERIHAFGKVSFRNLALFSIVAAGAMLYIMFKIDTHLILKNKMYQVMTGAPNPLMVGADVFSTFLGFDYLDDPESVLFRYPVYLYVFSLLCCLYGLFTALREKMPQAVFFLTLYTATILFPVLMGHMIQTRAVSYFLPFIVFFQALGGVRGLDQVFQSPTSGNRFLASSNTALSCVLLIYFATYSIGKYKALDAAQGNPYSKTRDYLTTHSNANDLVISDLQATIGGFYLWQSILEKNESIYNRGMLDSIYYLTGKPKATHVVLKDSRDSPKEVFPLSAFEEVARFENQGVRKTAIAIFKLKIREAVSLQFDAERLSQTHYVGGNGACQTEPVSKDGLKIACLETGFACSGQGTLSLPESLPARHFQLVILSRFSNRGTKTKTFFALATPTGLDMPGIYELNPLVSDIKDLDLFRENISTWDTTIQQASSHQNLYSCFSGRLFDGNTLIRGVRVIDFAVD